MKKILFASLLVLNFSVVDSNDLIAATFGDGTSGASSNEVWQIRYDGAAWNYSNSRYESTAFRYTRNNRTLMTKFAYNGKVTGSVYDDLLSGDKYTTKFSWWRGKLKDPFYPTSITNPE